jgi:hypothetical protein
MEFHVHDEGASVSLSHAFFDGIVQTTWVIGIPIVWQFAIKGTHFDTGMSPVMMDDAGRVSSVASKGVSHGG